MDYIVVLGAKMSNKGAQSMAFQIVNEMYRRYPQKKVVALMNHKPEFVKKMNAIYNFEIVSFQPADILYLYGGIQAAAAKVLGVSNENISHIKNILSNTCLAFDVSGYSLSSNWSGANSLKYLYQIAILKSFNIPTVLMPQSFGPFDYEPVFKQYINRLGKELLIYPAIIYARESFSYNIIKNQFNLKQIRLSKDMVLLGNEIDHNAIFKPGITLKNYTIDENCVAIIPNNKLAEKFTPEKAVLIYKTAIEHLLSYGRKIYILRHSDADISLCIKLKNIFKDNGHVTLLQESLNCLEYDLLIKQFDYIIASRYHALVHAYKQSVPCIAIGWSEKYNSLMTTINQSQYMVNAKNFDENILVSKINEMQKNYQSENVNIKRFFDELSEDIYDEIFNEITIKD